MKIMNKRQSMPLLAIIITLFLAPCAWAVSDQAGWPKDIGGNVASSPLLVDLDMDGDFEILIGSENGTVHAWHGDGSVVTGWPVSTGYNIISTPAAGDIDGDGELEIVSISTQTGVNVPKSNIYIMELDGEIVLSKNIVAGTSSSPALGDIDGDGELEIVAGADDNKVYAWESDGTDVAGWPQATGGEIFNSPALADLDADADLEIIAGSQDGNMYAWHHDGTLYWSLSIGAVSVSSPAIADIDADGNLEIVVATQSGLYAINSDGTILWSNAIEYSSSPALGDIDADGDFEIAIGTASLAPKNKVYLIDSDGTTIWSKKLKRAGAQEYRETVVSSPAIGDIDGDGIPEVIVSTISTFGEGGIYAWDNAGTLVWSAQKGIAKSKSLGSSPAIGDTDGDGDVEVIVGATDGKVHAWDFIGSYDPDNVKWGMFRRDARHHGTILLSNELGIVDAKTDETTYTRGDNVVISCNVLDVYGIGTSADSATATIDRPDGNSVTVDLQENAFGDYSLTYTNALWSGQYNVTIQADRSGYQGASAGLTFGASNPPFWQYRTPIDINAGPSDRTDAAIELAVNFTQKLADLGTSGTFDINSPRVFEADAGGNDLVEVPSEFAEQTGTFGTENIALGKTATTSSDPGPPYQGSSAVDGDINTVWAGTGNHNDELKVDLGENLLIYKVVVTGWGGGYGPQDFEIQVSTDDSSYTTVANIVDNTLDSSEHVFIPANGRYVKIVITENNGDPWTYIKEFEIYTVSGPAYDASTNAIGNLMWIMAGTTPAGTSRYYNLYFDTLETGTKEAPSYGVDYSSLVMPAGITVTEGTTVARAEPNEPPVATITAPVDSTVYNIGDTVSFNGDASTDYDGSLLSYGWSSSLDGSLGTQSSFSASDLQAGTHIITLTVTDDDTATASAQTTIRVNTPPTPLVVFPIDGSVHSQNDVIDFEATGTDTDGTIVSYEWTSDLDGALNNTNSFSATGLKIGTHTITLTVTDDDGATATTQISLKINNPPTVTITEPASGTNYSQEETASFVGTATDTDGTIASYEWESDTDGILGGTSTLTTTGLSKGTHKITLTATDNSNGTGTASITVVQKEYNVTWDIKKNPKLGTTIPIKFNVTHPKTPAFVVDESVIVRVYDPTGKEVFNATYSSDEARADTSVRINTTEQHYITNFHSNRDAPKGTYTIKAEFSSDRPGTDHSTEVKIPTRLQEITSYVGGGISNIINRGRGTPPKPPKEDKKAKPIKAPAAVPAKPVKLKILKNYNLRWLLGDKTQRPGSTIPITFTLRSPRTKGFVIDESVTVRVYDPDGSGVFMATTSGDGVWIDTKSEVYSTNYESPKDAPTGTYTVKVEVEGTTEEDYETTVEIHTRMSQAVDSVVKFIQGIFGR